MATIRERRKADGTTVAITNSNITLNPSSIGPGMLNPVPIAWKGGATFPVRAYVIAEDVG